MGCYIISVSAGTGCYRHIQISKDATLYMLHETILKAFEFEDAPGHVFFYGQQILEQWRVLLFCANQNGGA